VSRRKVWGSLALAGLVVAAAGGAAWWYFMKPVPFDGRINALEVNLAKPQAYVSTPALSRLPRDLIKAPLARDLLSEDFAFYYEEHEDRLGLQGAVKRLAYEHQLTLSDKLLEAALDEPAEIAWWVDAKGAPRHWVMAMTRGALARALEQVAGVAAKDKQLGVIGQVKVHGGQATVYSLALSSRRTLALVSQGNRLVVLSDPGLLFDAERQVDAAAREVVADLLSDAAAKQGVYRRAFGLGAPGPDHTLVADARLFTWGYQHFFPGLQALRLDVGDAGRSLNAHLRVQGPVLGATPAARAVWQGLPLNAAACAWLPTEWSRVQATLAPPAGKPAAASAPVLASDEVREAWAQVAAQLEGPAAVCWYARSQLHTPLLVARTKAGAPDLVEAMNILSAWLTPFGSEPTPDLPAQTWQYEVQAPWGPRGRGEKTSYRPTLARQGEWLSFSPDDTLVGLARDTQARRYPSLAEALPEGAATLAVFAPKDVADMGQREVFEVLPQNLASFRQAVDRQLVPRLDALRQWPAGRAVAAGEPDAQGWVPLQWQALTAAPAGARP
jgi:uncharacterized protein YfaA (DUF2138 family)